MNISIQRIYSSKIIKASALLTDTKTLLLHWNNLLSIEDNLKRAQSENIFGKASRSRVEDILLIFRQRYLQDEKVTKSLVTLAQSYYPDEALNQILYFYATQSDMLLHDTVTEFLLNTYNQGDLEVNIADLERWIERHVSAGKTTGDWSINTIRRCAQGLMSTLRDFGMLSGAVKKRITSNHLSPESFAYIAFYLSRQQPSGRMLLEHPEWKLFFLSSGAVERFFIEAQQRRLLEYHAAGSVIRIDFPAHSIEEYAHALVARAN